MNEEFYDIIARYYDTMQDGIDHDMWAKMLDSFIREFCTSEPQGEDGKRLIADLGCGSGTITIKLEQEHGYDCIGIDHSVLMLDEAKNIAGEDSHILWLNQDIGYLMEQLDRRIGRANYQLLVVGRPVLGTAPQTLKPLLQCAATWRGHAYTPRR